MLSGSVSLVLAAAIVALIIAALAIGPKNRSTARYPYCRIDDLLTWAERSFLGSTHETEKIVRLACDGIYRSRNGRSTRGEIEWPKSMHPALNAARRRLTDSI